MDPLERYQLYTQVSGPLGLVSAIICGIAVVTAYLYPQQRKFPNNVFVWTCMGDLAHALYVSLKWLPGPIRTHFTDQVVNPPLCYFSMYFQWTILEAVAMVSLLLAYTLYATIVKREELKKEKYYYRYLAMVWIPTLFIPLFGLSEKDYKVDAGLCKLTSPQTVIFRVANLMIPLLIQAVLMIQVFKAVRNATPKSSQKETLWSSCGKFFGAQLHEIFVWLPIMYWDILNMQKLPVSRALIVFSAVSPGFLAINGLIVLAANKQLRKDLHQFFKTTCSSIGFSKKLAVN